MRSVCLYMYKCLAAGNDWFTFYKNTAYNTKLSNQQALSYPNILTDHSRQSVRWVGVGLWNGLPVELRTQDVPYETSKDLRNTSLNGNSGRSSAGGSVSGHVQPLHG